MIVGPVENLLHGEIKINQVLTRQRTLKTRPRPRRRAQHCGPRAGDRDRRPPGPPGSDRIRHRRLPVRQQAREPLSYSSWRTNVWIPALKRAGLAQKKTNGQYLGLHDLRSMNRSIMDAQGVDLTNGRVPVRALQRGSQQPDGRHLQPHLPPSEPA